jgi:hypothetical protein
MLSAIRFRREATNLCFMPLFVLVRWLLVKPEAQTPPTPSTKRLKVESFAQVVAFGASPCFNALAAYLVRHRLCAQPNCLRCAPQAGGVDFVGLACAFALGVLTGGNPFPLGIFCHCHSVDGQKKSRFPVAHTKENGFGCPEALFGLIGVSVSILPRRRKVCQSFLTTPGA